MSDPPTPHAVANTGQRECHPSLRTEHRAISGCLCLTGRSVLARLICAIGAVLLGQAALAQQTVTASTSTPAGLADAAMPDPTTSQLAAYYRQIEARLVGEGRLRQDRRGQRLDAAVLSNSFMQIAMRSEYRLGGGGLSRSGRETALRRWERPIRMGVRFGASVPAGQRQADLAAVADVARRLQNAARHPVSVGGPDPNFNVLVLNDAERAGAGPVLRQLVPGLSRAAVNAVTRMGTDTFCMVIAVPGTDPSQGYVQAIAIVRAEHPPLMRRSCIEEELAQGMGLANDSPEARPSIFNDDEEFGVLTRHDELLLRMLYSDRLRPGMSPDQVEALVPELARAALSPG